MLKVEIIFSKENLAFESFTPITRYIFNDNRLITPENYEFYRYLDPDKEIAVSSKLSITSAAHFKDRIRFYHYSKVYDVFNFFIEALIQKIKKENINLSIHFYNCAEMLQFDILLINHILQRMKNETFPITLEFDEFNQALHIEEQTTVKKINVKSKIEPHTYWNKKNKSEWFERAMNLALFEDAIRIGLELFDESISIDEKCFFADKLGIAHVLYDKNDSGEYYYNFVLKQKCSVEIKVEVLYKLSMLYLRHHTKEKRDISKAKFYLSTAQNLIESSKKDLGKNYTFHKVFNRNGRALVLHREGKTEIAHQYCIDGSAQLLETYGPIKHILHRSVLLYNSTITSAAMKRYNETSELFKELLTLDPYYHDYWVARGDFHKSIGKYKEAIEDYSQAIKINPYFAEQHTSRAIAYEETGEKENAARDYRRAIELKPDHLDSLMNYGALLLSENQLNESLLVFKHLLKLQNSRKHETYNNIGLVFLEQDNVQEAIKYFNKALKYYPDFCPALMNLALTYYQLNKLDDSLKMINRALIIEDDNIDYLYNRAYLNLKLKNTRETLEDINVILKRDPINKDALQLKRELTKEIG